MTSSCSSLESPDGVALHLALLKSWDFEAWQSERGRGRLPYGIDQLIRRGIRLHWTDALHRPTWQQTRRGALIRGIESATVPFLQTLLMTGEIRNCAATLAMFESEANFLALLRGIAPTDRRKPFVVVSCWLAQLLASGSRSRLAGYRRAFRSVNRLYYFSRNQRPILEEIIPAENLSYLPFGVEIDEFTPQDAPDGGYLLAVGRDSGRDWPTFFSAVKQLDLPVKVCCRESQLAGLEIPPNVEIIGHVKRRTYRELLGRATAVAVVTKHLVYPSGQSVLLEAMAMARPVVVTSTPSLSDYIHDGEDCLAVPVGEPLALREAIERLVSDKDLRGRLGRNGRKATEMSHSSRAMWDSVAADLFELTGTLR